MVAGVSGSGKSTVGRAAAALAGVPFIDGDDLHPTRNVELMTQGTPLSDDDREPWLDAVAAIARDHAPSVVACSALARRYRDRLRDGAPGIQLVILDVPEEELRRRLESRSGHFMRATMLDSQLLAREHPEDEPGVTVVDGTRSVEALAAEVAALFGRAVD
ncbi:MAG: gluconokinase [Microcella sp.]